MKALSCEPRVECRFEFRREEWVDVGAVDPPLLEVWPDEAVVGLECVWVVELLERRWGLLFIRAGMVGSETVRVEVSSLLMAWCIFDLSDRFKVSSLSLSTVQQAWSSLSSNS